MSKSNKLFRRTFTKGDPIVYRCHYTGEDANGIYVDHDSFSTWHNGIEHHNCRHLITIIAKDGKETVVSWIRHAADK